MQISTTPTTTPVDDARLAEILANPGFGTYFMFGTDPKNSIGGMSNAATMMHAPAHWLHYIKVANLDETLKRISDKGGRVLNGPMEVPGGDRIAQCTDPQGGAFAVFASGRK